ncbi:MAG: PKD-like domain-containing protein [Bacteroidota bacterium]
MSFAQVVNSEGFEGGTNPPTGWTILGTASYWLNVTSGTFPTCSPHSGTHMAEFNSFSIASGNASYVTPSFSLSAVAANTPTVTGWFYRETLNYTTSGDSISVYINTSSSLTGATYLGRVARAAGMNMPNTVATTGWYQYTFNVPAAYTASAPAINYVIFKGVSAWGDNCFLDDVTWDSYPPPCSGAPIAGTISPAGPLNMCSPISTTFSLQGNTLATGITYQWQQSTNGGVSYTAIPGATSGIYTFAPGGNIMINCVVTCTSSGQSATTPAVTINMNGPTYATLPFVESFENWQSICGNTESPGVSWRNNPTTGNQSWRRDDQGVSTALWSSNLGTYTPAFSAGAHSARFHSYDATSGTSGTLDLFVSMPGAGSKQITYDYINTSGSDALTVLISSDGGSTFSQIDNQTTSSTWTTHTVTTAVNSTTAVLRFLATSDYGVTDIGVDNVNIISLNCAGAPTAGTITPAGPLNICAGSPVTLTLGGASSGGGISIQWQQSTNGGVSYTAIGGATSTTYTFTPTQNVLINAVVTCSFSGQSATAPAVTVNYVPLPTITPGAFPTVNQGTTIAPLTYTATGNPTQYSITWSAAALTAGFANVNNGVLPASPISLVVPAGAGVDNYTGTLTVTTATGCNSSSVPISVTVSNTPTIVLGASPTICAGTTTASQPYSAPTLNPTTYSIVWSPAAISAGFVNTTNATLPASPITITGIPAGAPAAAYTGTLTVSNGTGTSPNYTVTVNIAALPTITLGPNPTTCNGTTTANLTYTATTSSPTQYSITWAGNAIAAGFTNVVNATLPASPIVLTVPASISNFTYNGTITVKNGTCTGVAVPFSITILPLPTLTSTLTPADQCNNNVFHYTPTGGNGATVFSWYRAAVPGISNPAASGTGDPAETLVNTTTSPIAVTYAYTFTGSNGCSNTQNVTVNIKPFPVLSSPLSTTTCSYYVFNYTPTSATPGTTFAWTRATVTGVINYAGFGTGDPNEALDNVTDYPVDVTYAYTLNASGCISNVQNVVVTVLPNPTITSTLNPLPVCSNTAFNYVPTSNLSNSTFSWTRAAVPGISNAASNGSGNITETLINTTSSTVNVTYVYTVTANGCTSPNIYNVVVPVNPGPVMTSTLTPNAVCTNTLFSYTPVSSLSGTTFSWSRATVAGISNSAAVGTNGISETLVNTSSNPVTVTYSYTLSNNGCSSTADVNVVVNPVQTPSFTISSPTGNTVCNGDAINFTSTSNISNGLYNWKKNGVSLGVNTSTYSYVPVNGDIITCVITAAASACYVPSTITSNAVTIAVTPNVTPSITVSGPTSAVVGSTVTMTANVLSATSSYIINWYNNNVQFNSTTVPMVTYTKGPGTDLIRASVLPQTTQCYDTAISATPGHPVIAIGLGVNNTANGGDNIHVYPNPVNNVLYIDNIKETTSYRVLNLIGSVVEAGTLQTGSNRISTKDLASGVYMLELNNKNGEKSVTRIVKE